MLAVVDVTGTVGALTPARDLKIIASMAHICSWMRSTSLPVDAATVAESMAVVEVCPAKAKKS